MNNANWTKTHSGPYSTVWSLRDGDNSLADMVMIQPSSIENSSDPVQVEFVFYDESLMHQAARLHPEVYHMAQTSCSAYVEEAIEDLRAMGLSEDEIQRDGLYHDFMRDELFSVLFTNRFSSDDPTEPTPPGKEFGYVLTLDETTRFLTGLGLGAKRPHFRERTQQMVAERAEAQYS